MGLFGINLPTLYGEGRNAFRRLQEEIMRTMDDESIFAWNPNGPFDILAPPQEYLSAQSPRDLAEGSRIVEWTPEVGRRPFFMSNKGLQTSLTVVHGTHRQLFWVLCCRYQDDFRGPIAIRIQKVDEDTLAMHPRTPTLEVVELDVVNRAETRPGFMSQHWSPWMWELLPREIVEHDPQWPARISMDKATDRPIQEACSHDYGSVWFKGEPHRGNTLRHDHGGYGLHG